MHQDLRKLRIKMTTALLCVTMNPSSCFLQTLLGLMCYSYGLRDQGFELLNAFGCTCSVHHVREHGIFWANKRNVLEELDCTRPWRISIDNLNFHIKFAKNLTDAGSGPKKMLNLVTGQVSTRTVALRDTCSQGTLSASVHHSLATYACNIATCSLTEQSFVLDLTGEKDPYFDLFVTACFTTTVHRLHTPPLECKSTFIESLRTYLPHWTPSCADNVAYTTILRHYLEVLVT